MLVEVLDIHEECRYLRLGQCVGMTGLASALGRLVVVLEGEQGIVGVVDVWVDRVGAGISVIRGMGFGVGGGIPFEESYYPWRCRFRNLSKANSGNVPLWQALFFCCEYILPL